MLPYSKRRSSQLIDFHCHQVHHFHKSNALYWLIRGNSSVCFKEKPNSIRINVKLSEKQTN